MSLIGRLARWNELRMNNAEAIEKRKDQHCFQFREHLSGFFGGRGKSGLFHGDQFRLVSTFYL
jgi:hypothetical protein